MPFFQVCELHFLPEDIKRETSAFDERTGNTITVKLDKVCLQNGAIPRILPNCPSYLSSSSTFRESPTSRKIRLENSALQSALNQSIADNLAYEQQKNLVNIDDLEERLDFLDRNYWSVVRQQDTVIICHIIKCPYPKISLSLLIESNFTAHVFCNDVELKTIGEYQIPKTVNDQNTLEILIENMKKIDLQEQQTKPQNMISVLKLILSFLLLVQDESIKYFNTLKFIYEQISLMTMNKFDYSTEMMVFSSLFYNCSPRGYRLMRASKNVILPSYSTIRRLTLSSYMNPAVEQHDNNFLMYIKNKFKLLVQKDITVSLLVDEIHLKPYLDYKGGNIVGLANNSNEAATSAFAFMLSSVFSKYKDVVHVMPTRRLKAENLFDIIRRLIIGLEEIGFRVLSVITDNNAINKKAMSFFCSPAKLSIVYPHPFMKSRPLFFLFDSVHILKCIRNNWLGQKDTSKCMMFPKFCHNGNHQIEIIQSAPFGTLKKLHALESQSL